MVCSETEVLQELRAPGREEGLRRPAQLWKALLLMRKLLRARGAAQEESLYRLVDVKIR